MKTIVFFLEEPSAEEMLRGVLPKILPGDIYPEFKVFEGKSDLEKRLPILLRAWRKPGCLFLVMRDQDAGDCRVIKQGLLDLCRQAGKLAALVRIACHELESFYLGDLRAVENGLGIPGLAKKQGKSNYREPDSIEKPSKELDRLTGGVYQKVSGSRAIGPYLDLAANRSHSFCVLLRGIRRLIEAGIPS